MCLCVCMLLYIFQGVCGCVLGCICTCQSNNICVCVCVFLNRNVLVCPVEQNYIETRAPVSVQVPNDTERPRREQIALQLYGFAFHHFIHSVQRRWKENNTLRANFTKVIKFFFFVRLYLTFHLAQFILEFSKKSLFPSQGQMTWLTFFLCLSCEPL